MCAAAVAGVAVWHNEELKNAVHRQEIPVITETSETTLTESPTETAFTTLSEKSTSATSATTSAKIPEKTTMTTVSSSEKVIDTSAAQTESPAVTAETETLPPSSAPDTTASETSANTAATTFTVTTTAVSTTEQTTTAPSTGTNLVTSRTSNVLDADYINYGGLIKRVNYLPTVSDAFLLLDEDNVQHRVKVMSTEGMSDGEIISLMGETCFTDQRKFRYIGIYEDEFPEDAPFMDVEHYSYISQLETIYSTELRLYPVTLESGEEAFAVRFMQGNIVYLYTPS